MEHGSLEPEAVFASDGALNRSLKKSKLNQ